MGVARAEAGIEHDLGGQRVDHRHHHFHEFPRGQAAGHILGRAAHVGLQSHRGLAAEEPVDTSATAQVGDVARVDVPVLEAGEPIVIGHIRTGGDELAELVGVVCTDIGLQLGRSSPALDILPIAKGSRGVETESMT